MANKPKAISIYTPARGATSNNFFFSNRSDISIYTPARGATADAHTPCYARLNPPKNANPLFRLL